MPARTNSPPGSLNSTRGQLSTTTAPQPVTSRSGVAHPLRHEVSHALTSRAQASTADMNPYTNTRQYSFTSSLDSPPPLTQRMSSTLRRARSTTLPLQGKHSSPLEEPNHKPLHPRVFVPSRESSSSVERQSSIAPRPSNVSGFASLVHSTSSREWPVTNSETSHQASGHSRQDSRAAYPNTDSGHESNYAETFESDVDLDELRRIVEKMQQREAHFIKRNGRKLHRYPANAVPYPRSYDREVVDHDVWCLIWARQVSGNVAWHMYKKSPRKALDLGCGTGTWILDAAKSWKDTHFVGLDIVPLYPNLEEIDPILAWRVTWVQANFLERLPFADGEFDFVHVRRIARGIPEDKWDHVLEEISRILKSGGAFQISEEDLYFPGVHWETPMKKDGDSTTANADKSQVSKVVSPPLARPRTPTPSSSSPTSQEQQIPLSATPSISQSMSERSNGSSIVQRDGSSSIPDEPPIDPYDHSLLEFIYNEMHAARFINLAPLSLLSNLLPLYFQGVRTHPPLVAMFPPPPHESCNLGTSAPQPQYLTKNIEPPMPATHVVHSEQEGPPSEPKADLMSSETITTQIFRLDLARIQPSPDGKTPFVHIPQLVTGTAKYVSVDMARYTAYAPRSLFQSNQFQKKEPPPALPKDSEGADRLNPAAGAGGSNDGAVPPAEDWPDAGKDRMPISAIKFDARTLNLHLSMRVQEVLACAEAMWEFVEALQKKADLDPSERAPSLSSSQCSYTGSDSSKPPRPAHKTTRDPKWKELFYLRRVDFDALLRRFAFDMQDCLGFSAVLEDRLGWSPVPTERSEERMEFDALCDAWATYQETLARPSSTVDNNGVPQSNTPSAPRSSTSIEPHSPRSDEGQDTMQEPKAGVYPALQKVRESGNARISQGKSLFTSKPIRQHPIPPHERLSKTTRLFVAFKS
ncbi:hypothetical protein DAEQUDRAFT_769258 [Daedalea quercina L-15889]|uniref:Methyltransferase domain-containing protein n=1 Tax=Daedalea quercina L-15889 TaxID=1314783 RepID=A0A165LVY0_9APHY|nr:hypothetical protein DAEQUDRAFT_769258 [Daedalea quercina L-15889]